MNKAELEQKIHNANIALASAKLDNEASQYQIEYELEWLEQSLAALNIRYAYAVEAFFAVEWHNGPEVDPDSRRARAQARLGEAMGRRDAGWFLVTNDRDTLQLDPYAVVRSAPVARWASVDDLKAYAMFPQTKIGETVQLVTGYHPRHGKKYTTWTRSSTTTAVSKPSLTGSKASSRQSKAHWPTCQTRTNLRPVSTRSNASYYE